MSIWGPTIETESTSIAGEDADLSAYVKKTGTRMTGRINMGGKKITGLANPTESQDAATAQYVANYATHLNDIKLNTSGGTLTGELAMSEHRITALGGPTENKDATPKEYVDAQVQLLKEYVDVLVQHEHDIAVHNVGRYIALPNEEDGTVTYFSVRAKKNVDLDLDKLVEIKNGQAFNADSKQISINGIPTTTLPNEGFMQLIRELELFFNLNLAIRQPWNLSFVAKPGDQSPHANNAISLTFQPNLRTFAYLNIVWNDDGISYVVLNNARKVDHTDSLELDKCPKTLGTVARHSSWFKERFKPGLKMFLDEKDIYNFDNYFKISHYELPFGYATVDRNILGLIMNNANFSNAPITELSDKCVRCAVVGCGGILNGSNAGQEIDSHDFVFRVNRAITSGKYAQDVGRKTSFYEFFPESQNVWAVEYPNAAYLFTPFKKVDLYYAESMLRKDTSSRYFNVEGENKTFFIPPLLDPSRVKITHPDFFRYIFTNFMDLKGYRPTTGALVVFSALYMCDEVTIYGFGYDPRFTIHYYDNQFLNVSDSPTGLHDINNEKKLWNKLHSEGVIRLFKRDF
ncbi:uncharacterized protein [Amphiura filiformis]|uniref:uncharacterized protein n=1 Tax=Amphiura filiformis TaxID=82378 RepID=UPI003B21BBF7